jgi:hypothetical protein
MNLVGSKSRFPKSNIGRTQIKSFVGLVQFHDNKNFLANNHSNVGKQESS